MWNIGGRVCNDTLDELYDKFTRLSISLSDDTTSWSIQICFCYLSVFATDITEAITFDASFFMPELTTLTSNALQLEALRTVSSQDFTKYKELEKQKAQMTDLLRSMHTSQQRGMGLATMI